MKDIIYSRKKTFHLRSAHLHITFQQRLLVPLLLLCSLAQLLL